MNTKDKILLLVTNNRLKLSFDKFLTLISFYSTATLSVHIMINISGLHGSQPSILNCFVRESSSHVHGSLMDL